MKTSGGMFWAVYWVGFGAVNRAVAGTVDMDVYDAVHRAVVGGGYDAVGRPVRDAVSGAVGNDPPHPSLPDFLAAASAEPS